MPKRKHEAKKRKSDPRKSPRLNPNLEQPESSLPQTQSLLDRASKIVLKIQGKSRQVNERNLSEKFLDRMAKILEGSSKAIAVAFVNGKFIIAANEITQGSTHNRIMDLINQSMEYFSDLVNREKNLEATEEELLTIISYHVGLLASMATAGYEETELLPQIRRMIHMELRGENLNGRQFIQEFNKYVPYVAKARAAYVTILQDFAPLKAYFEDKKGLSKKQRTAFKKMKRGYVILQHQPQRVHAEAQILSEIIKLFEHQKFRLKKKSTSPQEIYIGISKLCCPHCRIMLEVTNIVFKEKGIPIIIKYAGEHSMSFDWTPPDILEEGFNQEALSSEEQESLSHVIGFLTANRIAELEESEMEKCKGKTKAPISMIATPSPNKARLGIDDRIKLCVTQLENELELYKQGLSLNPGLEKSIILAESALKLIQHHQFKYYQSRKFTSHLLIAKLKGLIRRVLPNATISETDLLLFLTNKNVFDEDITSFLKTTLIEANNSSNQEEGSKPQTELFRLSSLGAREEKEGYSAPSSQSNNLNKSLLTQITQPPTPTTLVGNQSVLFAKSTPNTTSTQDQKHEFKSLRKN